MQERRYVVKNSKQIESTDWSVISNTKENKITLITCIKNQPHLRFCVKAVEETKCNIFANDIKCDIIVE